MSEQSVINLQLHPENYSLNYLIHYWYLIHPQVQISASCVKLSCVLPWWRWYKNMYRLLNSDDSYKNDKLCVSLQIKSYNKITWWSILHQENRFICRRQISEAQIPFSDSEELGWICPSNRNRYSYSSRNICIKHKHNHVDINPSIIHFTEIFYRSERII